MGGRKELAVGVTLGVARNKSYVSIRKSNECINLVACMAKFGCIRGYTVEGNQVFVYLKYIGSIPMFRHLKQVSKISKREDVKKNMFQHKKTTALFYVVSTNKGLVCFEPGDINEIGGEVILIGEF